MKKKRISKDSIEDVRQSDILFCFPNAKQKGLKYIDTCPNCKRSKSLIIYKDPRLNRRAAKCFHCGLFISNPIDAVKVINDWNTNDRFPDVVQEAAKLCLIELKEEDE